MVFYGYEKPIVFRSIEQACRCHGVGFEEAQEFGLSVSNQPPPTFCLEFGELLKVYSIPFGESQHWLCLYLVTATQRRFSVSTNLKTHRPAAEAGLFMSV